MCYRKKKNQSRVVGSRMQRAERRCPAVNGGSGEASLRK